MQDIVRDLLLNYYKNIRIFFKRPIFSWGFPTDNCLNFMLSNPETYCNGSLYGFFLLLIYIVEDQIYSIKHAITKLHP